MKKHIKLEITDPYLLECIKAWKNYHDYIEKIIKDILQDDTLNMEDIKDE